MPPHPRYAPQMAFPPYTYVPGRAPHPVTDPRGHMYGAAHESVELSERADSMHSPTYRYGIDLFNYGYYWEAHEAWERLWIALGRAGVAADFVKGLIKLAAAGVKVREGNRTGATRHLTRAAQLFQQTMEGGQACDCFGLDIQQLLKWAGNPPPDTSVGCHETVTPVFDFVLILQTPES